MAANVLLVDIHVVDNMRLFLAGRLDEMANIVTR
jgi:hypothetical protein